MIVGEKAISILQVEPFAIVVPQFPEVPGNVPPAKANGAPRPISKTEFAGTSPELVMLKT